MISVFGTEKLTLTEIEAFLSASESVRVALRSQAEVCEWVEGLLCGKQYARQGRRARGLLRAYVAWTTRLSRAQTTRLIAEYATGWLAPFGTLHRLTGVCGPG
jgi:hypothetical protein